MDPSSAPSAHCCSGSWGGPGEKAVPEEGWALSLWVLSPTSAGFQQPEAPAHPHTELCPGAAEGLQGGWGHREGE